MISLPNKSYLKGYRLERDIRLELEGEGCLVLRSGGSHSKIDLVAICSDKVRLIQAKAWKKYTEKQLNDELKELGKIKVKYPFCSVELWVRNRGIMSVWRV